MKIAITVILALALTANATDYYVDYDGGNNANNGLTTQTAKKTVPSVVAGDRVLLRGGVIYRAGIMAGNNGVSYIGTAWGEGRAIVDGSIILSGWRDLGSGVWETTTTIPSSPLAANLYWGDQALSLAQTPDCADPYHPDDLNDYWSVPAASVTRTSIADPRLADAGGQGLVGGYVGAWVSGNALSRKPITGYTDTPTPTITFESLDGAPYTDKPMRYALFNAPPLMTQPGEYTVIDAGATRTIRLISLPVGHSPDGNPTDQVTMTILKKGFDCSNRSNLLVEGIELRRFSGAGYGDGIALGKVSSTTTTNITIRDCLVRQITHADGTNAVDLRTVSGLIIEDSSVEDSLFSRGILVNGANITVRRCTVKRAGGTAIYFSGVRTGEISANTVTDCRGVHGNGISVYQNSDNVLIAGNRVINSNIAMTLEYSTNLTVQNNILWSDDPSIGTCLSVWGGASHLKIFNNLIDTMFVAASNSDVTIQNNIINGLGGAGGPIHNHNIYTALDYTQDPQYGWVFGAGEIVTTDTATLYTDLVNHDFHSTPESPAIDAGISVPVALDIDGTTRPINLFDIGPYEYGAAIPPAPTPGWTIVDGDGISHEGTGSATLTGIPTGPVSISYDSLAGYDTPDTTTHTLMPGAIVNFNAVYRKPVGSVNIMVTPATASWSFTDSTGNIRTGIGNATISNIPVGDVTMTWGTLDGYDAPAGEVKTIPKNGSASFSAAYVRQTGTVAIRIEVEDTP